MTNTDRTSPTASDRPWGRRAARLVALFDRFEWLLLLILSPALLLPSMGRMALVLLLPALWLAVGLLRRRLLPGTPLDWPLAILGFMVLVSAGVTYDLSLSLPKIAGVILGLGLFRVVARGRGAPLLPLGLLLGLGCAIAGIGLLATQWVNKVPFLTPVLSRLPRAFTAPLPGTDVGINPNEVAGALLWVVPVVGCALAACLRARRTLVAAAGRTWAAVLLVALAASALLTTGTLLLTQSRSAYLALVGTAGVALLLFAPRPWRRIFAGLAAAALVAAVVLLATGVAGSWVSRLVGGQDSGSQGSLNTLEQRAEVWSRAIYGIEDFPFTGMGMNTFRRIVHVLYPLFSVGPDVDIAHAHNEFLQAALDLGLPGLVAFVALYLGTFWMLAQTWRSAGLVPAGAGSAGGLAAVLDSPPLARLLPIGLAAGLFAHMLYGMTDAIALGAKPGAVYWLMLGLGVRVFLRSRRASELAGSESAAAGCSRQEPAEVAE